MIQSAAVSLHSLLSDSETVLRLEPEEFAGVLLEYLHTDDGKNYINRNNIATQDVVKEYPRQYQDRISGAVMEAWVWLEREGLVVPNPSMGATWYRLSRRGEMLRKKQDVDAYRKGNLLPQNLLHPIIIQKVYSAFLRGEYDTAVFQALREVEVAVRTAGKYQPNDLGVDLMRKAFHPATGPLTDKTEPMAEREALGHLFAGTIGLYKNPTSHRNVPIEAPGAVEIIVLASHLLRIVDGRSS